MKEFENIRSIIREYHHDGHSLIQYTAGACYMTAFTEMKDLGYIDKSQLTNSNLWLSPIKSKIKGADNKYSAWIATTCHNTSGSTYSSKDGKPLKLLIIYGSHSYDMSPLSLKFCNKLVQKLRSYYGEDTSANWDYRKAYRTAKKIGFGCECLSKKLNSWGNCKSDESDDFLAQLNVSIYDFD